MFDKLLKRKGMIFGAVMPQGLPAHEMLSVTVAPFRVQDSRSDPPFGGEPPPGEVKGGFSVQEAEQALRERLDFEERLPQGFYFFDVGIIAFYERDGRMTAQVEHFWPLKQPVKVTAKARTEVNMTVSWPDLPFDELHHYGTISPQK